MDTSAKVPNTGVPFNTVRVAEEVPLCQLPAAAWVAVMTAVPAPTMDTTSPDTVATAVFADEYVNAPALLLVGATSVKDASAAKPKTLDTLALVSAPMEGMPGVTVTVIVTDPAFQLSVEATVAVMTAEPAPAIIPRLPETTTTPAADEAYDNAPSLFTLGGTKAKDASAAKPYTLVTSAKAPNTGVPLATVSVIVALRAAYRPGTEAWVTVMTVVPAPTMDTTSPTPWQLPHWSCPRQRRRCCRWWAPRV